MYRPKVYTASKIRHAALWRSWQSHYPQIEVTARWTQIAAGVPDHQDTTFWLDSDRIIHWVQDIQDVQRSDYVLVYAEPKDELKGTLIEAGAGIGLGKVILTVGLSEAHSWTSHPLVFSFLDLGDVTQFILSGSMVRK